MEKNSAPLSLSDFDFSVPENLVAQQPLIERDASRLLIRSKNAELQHSMTMNLCDHIKPGSLVLMNNSRVIPSRLIGKTVRGGKFEIFLLEQASNENDSCHWYALGRPIKKIRPNDKLFFADGVEIEIVDLTSSKDAVTPFLIKVNRSGEEFDEWIHRKGYIPLPPYIKRKDPKPADTSEDRDRYQTIYADPKGSVAAPTAGLHFTESLLLRLKERDIQLAFVTLHVGAGTFLPVKAENLNEHIMHKERFSVPSETLALIRKALDNKSDIVAVGTTTLRCLESFHLQSQGELEQMQGMCDQLLETSLFLKPKHPSDRYKPWAINALLTNFHQPKSTLFMLVSALFGLNEMKTTYAKAMAKKYRLFSYGDACLLWL